MLDSIRLSRDLYEVQWERTQSLLLYGKSPPPGFSNGLEPGIGAYAVRGPEKRECDHVTTKQRPHWARKR